MSKKISIPDYANLFNGQQILQKAYENAWDARKFEIELYWKRATYFWTFIASSFIAYAAFLNSDDYQKPTPDHPEIVYFVICIGLVVSFAWCLVNQGSIIWQRHWENHIVLLEDTVSGPLYKTLFKETIFSVSRINEIVSVFFCFIWLLLGINYWTKHDLDFDPKGTIDYNILLGTSLALVTIGVMYWGYGRFTFKDNHISKYNLVVP